MEFIKANQSDLDEIMKIIEFAQLHFKNEGIDQWQDNYPNHKVISQDIENKNSYVFKLEGKIYGTAAIIFDGDENYDSIYNGKWLSNDKYAVIHRLAIDFKHRGTGIASMFLKNVEKLCRSKSIFSIKIDTHKDNIPMKNLLLKNGYSECGVIYLKDKSQRIAFEKLL